MSDKEIIDKLIDLTDGTIEHFDREDAMDMLYEVKRLIGKREESGFCQKVLDQIKAELWMEGMNMTGEYQGVWVRFRDIERIIDKYIAEESEDKEDINPYEKCKTCGQDRASCCGCQEVLELERKKKRE